MIIELPPTFAYDALSEILSEDLFLPALSDDEEYDMDGVAHKRRGVMGMKGSIGAGTTEGGLAGAMGKVNAMESGMLSDAELAYTSTSASESELEPFGDSGLESDAPDRLTMQDLRKKQRSRSVVAFNEEHEREIALHSPGKLLNTPRDSSRRYEYPFPAGTVSSPSDSPASTPAISPLIAGIPSPTSSSMSVNSINLILAPPDVSSSRTAPIPIPISPSQVHKGSRSAATSPSSATLTHPRLSKFKPGDGPVPPSLRGRMMVFDGTAIPHTMRSLPPTPTGAAGNPLERGEKRSRSQEPETVSGMSSFATAPTLRKSSTAPTIPVVQSLPTFFAQTQRTPDAALLPLPDMPPHLLRSTTQTTLQVPPFASPTRTIIDIEMDFDLQPHVTSSQFTALDSSTPSLSPAPTITTLHPDDPGTIDFGVTDNIALDRDGDGYEARFPGHYFET